MPSDLTVGTIGSAILAVTIGLFVRAGLKDDIKQILLLGAFGSFVVGMMASAISQL